MAIAKTYQLDLGRYELRRSDGIKIKLERQPMELLILLVEKRNQLVTREQVAARLWPDGISGDTVPAINNAVRKIRAALRDSAESPKHLETVVGKGYRFIGDLDVVVADQPEAATVPEAPRPARRAYRLPAIVGTAIVLAGLAIGVLLWRRTYPASIRSIAVLPLQNLSGDPAQNYFADGLTDELTTNLAKIGSLRIVSRTSTLQYAGNRKALPQIARELNVDAVIEGSVVRSGSKVRVTAQLIDARRDAHLWAQSYTRDTGEILELQDSVALDIATQVKATLSPRERATFASHVTVKPEAYDAYLRGRSEIGRQTPGFLNSAVQYFQRAIELEPGYASAYAGLADALSLTANYGVLPPRQVFPRAEAAARKALELDPSSAEAHASLAVAKHHFDWDWPGAEAEYRQALQLSPGLAIAHLRYAGLLSNGGRHEEAIREINLARQSDPLSLTILQNVGATLIYARRYDDAIRELRGLTELHPDRGWPWVFLAMAHAEKRMYPEAIAEYRRADDVMHSGRNVGLAYTYAITGRSAEARKMLVAMEKPDESGVLDWTFIASVYVALGDSERAFRWLDQAYENRDFFLTYLKVTPWFDPLRDDRRFTALTERVGIPPGP
jgi:TolB-like protein/DNA-binding winged helix-turn-helix (wHTH) protein/Tfp pilus assembly protein PilF